MLCEVLVDDSDARRLRGIGGAEGAAAQHGNAHGVEVAFVDGIAEGREVLAVAGHLEAFRNEGQRFKVPRAFRSEGNVLRESRAVNSGRFANPFIRHALWDISLHGATKMKVRVVPTIVEYAERHRTIPQLLTFGFAMYLLFSRGKLQDARRRAGQAVAVDANGDKIRAAWDGIEPSQSRALAAFVGRVCTDRSLWGRDLAALPGFTEAVTDHLTRADVDGVVSALGAALSSSPTATSRALP